MNYLYQIFGSESSLDLDVCFFVSSLSNIENNHKKVETCIKNSDFDTNKKVNANLAIVKNGVVDSCFKGTPDELNNSLFYTYKLHNQPHKNKITRLVDRNVKLRVERCARTLVSYFTRTELRKEAKNALKNDLNTKIEFLKTVNLNQIVAFGKNGTNLEIYKSIAFQLGMTLGLYHGIELYTKEAIGKKYPELSPYLLRSNSNSKKLNEYLTLFILQAEKRMLE